MNTRRARKLIRKRRRLENSKLLGFVAHRITDKSLWIANYDTVARGVFVGFFWMMIPLPLQTTPVVISAIILRANMPIAISTVWISNPLTWVPKPLFLGSFVAGLLVASAGYMAVHVLRIVNHFLVKKN